VSGYARLFLRTKILYIMRTNVLGFLRKKEFSMKSTNIFIHEAPDPLTRSQLVWSDPDPLTRSQLVWSDPGPLTRSQLVWSDLGPPGEEQEEEEQEEDDERKRRRSDSFSLTFDDSLSWCVIGGLRNDTDCHAQGVCVPSDTHSTVSSLLFLLFPVSQSGTETHPVSQSGPNPNSS